MNCKMLNQTLGIYQKAKDEYLQLCQSVDQEIIKLDKNNLLQPGDISIQHWTMTFEFARELKKALWQKFLTEPKPDFQGFCHMTRDELEDYILEKELDMDVDDYKDDPLEDLIDAIKGEIGDCGPGMMDDHEIGYLDCKFEHIGFCLLKPDKSDNVEINTYVQMESDDSNWPLIKNTASYLGGEIHLHEDLWEFNEIKVKTFDLSADIDPKVIAQEIVKTADKIWEMSKKDIQEST